jgi:CheY-like chemotaxis protein
MTQILVVDDEKIIRDLLHLALSQAGYEVVEACNGLEGLAVYYQTGIELVISVAERSLSLLNLVEML